MILATIEFPNGSRIDFNEKGRWTGDDEVLVTYANDFRRTPGHQPDFVAALANEIADKIGGKVVFVIPYRNSAPPDALY